MKSYCNWAVCQAPVGGSVAAALGRSQELSDLVATEVVAVVHHCVYCYTLWNASASRACAGHRAPHGTVGRKRSRKHPSYNHLSVYTLICAWQLA